MLNTIFFLLHLVYIILKQIVKSKQLLFSASNLKIFIYYRNAMHQLTVIISCLKNLKILVKIMSSCNIHKCSMSELKKCCIKYQPAVYHGELLMVV